MRSIDELDRSVGEVRESVVRGLPSEGVEIPGGVLLREALAEQAHAAWAGWVRYMYKVGSVGVDGSLCIPADKAQRWERQMVTPYEELPENEKTSDRLEADGVFVAINRAGYEAYPIEEIAELMRDVDQQEEQTAQKQSMDVSWDGVHWDQFSRYVYPALVEVMDRATTSELAHSVRDYDGFRSEVSKQIADISITLRNRGRSYGENVLFLLREEGISVLAVTKAMRLLWSVQHGQGFAERADTWLDLAGYCVLAMAVEAAMSKR